MRLSEESDPFLDIDEYEGDDTEVCNQELGELIAKLQDSEDSDNTSEASDLVSAEDDVPVCAEFADDKWDKEFMSELGPADKLLYPDDDSDDADTNDEDEDEDATAMEESPPRLKCLDEAISCLGDICDFLENRGYTKQTAQMLF